MQLGEVIQATKNKKIQHPVCNYHLLKSAPFMWPGSFCIDIWSDWTRTILVVKKHLDSTQFSLICGLRCSSFGHVTECGDHESTLTKFKSLLRGKMVLAKSKCPVTSLPHFLKHLIFFWGVEFIKAFSLRTTITVLCNLNQLLYKLNMGR